MYPERGGPIERQCISLKNAAFAGNVCARATVIVANESAITDDKVTVSRTAHDALATRDDSTRMQSPGAGRWSRNLWRGDAIPEGVARRSYRFATADANQALTDVRM
jgi:hypothetical protein